MDIKSVKELSFPQADISDWEAAAEAGLKGQSLSRLYTETYEGIRLKPLYMGEEKQKENSPSGEFPYTRGSYAPRSPEQDWLIAQPVTGKNLSDVKARIHEAVSSGQNAAVFPVSLFKAGIRLDELIEDIKDLPLYIDAEGMGPELFEQLAVFPKGMKGVLAEDPAAQWAMDGLMPEDLDGYFEKWFASIRRIRSHSPELRTILIKGDLFHHAGGHAVQEAAYALSAAAYYLQEGQKHGFSPEELASQFLFSFAADSRFFMTIAKLRAVRRLWAQFADAYGTERHSFRMETRAVTSPLFETVYDEHMNLLRGANQAFAAVLGGVRYLEVLPFIHAEGKESAHAERLARNIQLILKNETYLTIADPAGGSWYVENLTDEMADKAWKLFLEIEQAGGYIAMLEQGKIQDELSLSYQKLEKAAAERRLRLIGTNVYPQSGVHAAPAGMQDRKSSFSEPMTRSIKSVSMKRLAEPFERLRARSAAYAADKGKPPVLGLLLIGEEKHSKPRADFVKGLAAAGGIETEELRCKDAGEAADFVRTLSGVVCFCGRDEDYPEQVPGLAASIKHKYPETIIYLAGKQPQETEALFAEAGVQKWLAADSDAEAVLNGLLLELGVEK